MLKVDCHFHPNLLLCINKSKKISEIRKSFEQHDLDAVLVCEHAYKMPKKTYKMLKD